MRALVEPEPSRPARAAGRSGDAWLIVAALSVAVLGWSAAVRIPVLVWNGSASSPRGLYVVVPGRPLVGDFVIAWPPATGHALAVMRGYLSRGVPLVITVAAAGGDRVCARDAGLWRNGHLIAARRRTDRAQRALPWWSGCRTLPRDEVLLLGFADPASFDGRYFGPVENDHVLGKAIPLWTR